MWTCSRRHFDDRSWLAGRDPSLRVLRFMPSFCSLPLAAADEAQDWPWNNPSLPPARARKWRSTE